MGEWVNMTGEDLGECAKLYVQVFNSAPWNDHWTVETSYKRLLDIHDSPGFVGLKFMMAGRIKGAVLGNCEQWYRGMQFNLKEMYVSNELQGAGIGSRLFHVLEPQLLRLDVRSICLFTLKGDFTEPFYRKNGFSDINAMVMMSKRIEQDD